LAGRRNFFHVLTSLNVVHHLVTNMDCCKPFGCYSG
jgi:hypothetical protein